MPSPSPLPRPAPGPPSGTRPVPRPSAGPPGLLAALDPAEAGLYRALRRDWHARIRPVDEAERAAADTVVGRAWRRWRLEAVEEQVLRALGRGVAVPGLPSLATLTRYRARLAADHAVLADELAELRDSRPARAAHAAPEPARVRPGEPVHVAPEAPSPAPPTGAVEPAHAAPEPPPPPGWALRHPPPPPPPRTDWLASVSRYALEAGLLARGRSTGALKDPRTTPS